jgi:hypothetical protein
MERRNIAIARAAYAELLKQSLGLIVERLSALPEVERINVFGSYGAGISRTCEEVVDSGRILCPDSLSQRLAR